MKVLGLVFTIFWTFWPSAAEAQTARAILKHPIVHEGFVEAIRSDNELILNVPCMALVETANEIYGSEHADCAELADYLKTLSVQPCPMRETRLTRVLADGSIDWKDWSRQLREGETCLYDNNEARWIASLSCGNYIVDELPVYTAMVRDELPAESPISWTPSARNLFSSEALSRSLEGVDRNEGQSVATVEEHEAPPKLGEKRSWIGRNWKWLVPTLAGVTAGTAAACYHWCVNENVNYNVITINVP